MWNPFQRRSQFRDIAPDEIFLDSSNLPGHNSMQFEGRVERPVSSRAVSFVGIFFTLVTCLFAIRAFNLQIAHGQTFSEISRENVLESSLLFATRGTVFDRRGLSIAWNDLGDATSTPDFSLRKYTPLPGLSHLLGWVRYPKQDKAGTWWRAEYSGMSGIELMLDAELAGTNGKTMIESDARGKVQRANIVSLPKTGLDEHLSIDAEMQSKLFSVLSEHAQVSKFVGGAAAIIDARTGELLALTSFPEYDHQAFTNGDSASVAQASNDSKTPLLNRAVAGLYAPGSIVKPIFAAAALNEHLISPDKIIVSTGAISVPNPYDKEHPSLFRDWAVHGAIDMRTALAVSSDEYFYTIGGGFGDQQGLGIDRIDTYARMFGLGSVTGISLKGEEDGNIPTPAWKAKVFGSGDPWRIGDTYHTAIGQYGFQITPLQAVRFVAAVANGGKLLTPKLIASSTPEYSDLKIPDAYLQIVREGMRLAVTSPRSDATVKSLYLSGIQIAAKTGTAQIGAHNEWMNSWSIGFWPAENPRFAYAVVLERAPAGTASGAAPGLVPFFQWLIENRPEYVN